MPIGQEKAPVVVESLAVVPAKEAGPAKVAAQAKEKILAVVLGAAESRAETLVVAPVVEKTLAEALAVTIRAEAGRRPVEVVSFKILLTAFRIVRPTVLSLR